eukprot:620199-Prorocentrum_minimum.AAC.2
MAVARTYGCNCEAARKPSEGAISVHELQPDAVHRERACSSLARSVKVPKMGIVCRGLQTPSNLTAGEFDSPPNYSWTMRVPSLAPAPLRAPLPKLPKLPKAPLDPV